MLTWL